MRAIPPKPSSLLSLAQSPSEDGFSVVSQSETLDPESAEQQPHVPKELLRITEVNNALSLELSQIKQLYNDAIEQVAAQKAAKQTADDSVRKQLNVLSQNINKPVADIPSLIKDHENGEKEITSLNWRLIDFEERFQKLQSEAQEVQDEKFVLRFENMDLSNKIRCRDSELTTLKSARDSAEEQVKDVTHRLTALRDHAQTLHDDLENWEALSNAQLAEMSTLEADLQSQKRKHKRAIAKRDERIATLQTEVSNLKAKKHDNENEVQTLHDEIARLQAVNEGLENELAEREDEVEEGKQRLHNARERGRRLKGQRDGARAANKAGGAGNGGWDW